MGAPVALTASPGDRPSASDPWVTPEEIQGCSVGRDVDLVVACAIASQVLYSLSGRKFGVRQDKVRPVGPSNPCSWDRNQTHHGIKLKGPVRSIDQVKINGIVLDPGRYRMMGNTVVLNDGSLWPVSQQEWTPDTEPGTCSIIYQRGMNVPVAGKQAAATFACEIAKYMEGDSSCRLPDRILSVTRQGLTYTKIDPTQFIEQARTGLYLPDIWLGSVQSGGRRTTASVTSPDSIRLVREELTPEEGGNLTPSSNIATYIGADLPFPRAARYVWYKTLPDGTVDVIVEDGQ